MTWVWSGALLYDRMWFQNNRAAKQIKTRGEEDEQRVNNLTKQAIHDKLDSQINTAEAKLNTLKRRAETSESERV